MSSTTLELLETRRLLAVQLDPAFGGGGIVLDDQAGLIVDGGVAVDPNGNIIAVGGPGGTGVARMYSSTGSSLAMDPLPGFSDAIDVAVAPDGGIIVVGTSGNQNLIVARYNADGTLDTDFGNSGSFEYMGGTASEMAMGVAIRPDGRIIVVGDENGNNFAVLQLDASGAPSGLDGDGYMAIDLGSSSDKAYGVALQSDGTAVIVGETSAATQDFALVLLEQDGTWTAHTVTDNDSSEWLNEVAVGVGDAIYATSSDATGGVLATFAADGTFVTSVAVPGTESGTAAGVAVDNTGKVYVTGFNNDFESLPLSRFNADGSVDGTFGTGGNVLGTTGGSFVLGIDVALHLDGVVVFGNSDDDFALARWVDDNGGGGNQVTAVYDGNTGQLVVTGTAEADDVSVVAAGPGMVEVFSGDTSLGTFPAAGTTIVVNAGEGDDTVDISTDVTAASELYGGEGNDTISGGGGSDAIFGEAGDDWLRARGAGDIVVGGDGNDVTTGAAARDVLIGGSGADRMVGDAESDILVSGSTSYDTDLASLKLIRAEWLSGGTFFARVNNLENGTGLNGPSVVLTTDTVFDDNARDTLTGGSDTDWFLIHLNLGALDVITDLNAVEFLGVLDFILS